MRIEIPDEDRDSVSAALRSRAAYWRRRPPHDRDPELASRLDQIAGELERGGSDTSDAPRVELTRTSARQPSTDEETSLQAGRDQGRLRAAYDDDAIEEIVRAVVPRGQTIDVASYGILVSAARHATQVTAPRFDGLVYPGDVTRVLREAIEVTQPRSSTSDASHPEASPRMRVVDALQLPEVLDGSRWVALPLPECSLTQSAPADATLPQLTVGVRPERGRMFWCDGFYDPRALRPSCFGIEAALTLPQLLGECTLVDAKKGPTP